METTEAEMKIERVKKSITINPNALTAGTFALSLLSVLLSIFYDHGMKAARLDAMEVDIVKIKTTLIRMDERTNQRFDKMQEEMNARFDKVDDRFREVDEHFREMDTKFREVDMHFDRLEEKIQSIDVRLTAIEKRKP
jgi:septation ring formation regulator EzrA